MSALKLFSPWFVSGCMIGVILSQHHVFGLIDIGTLLFWPFFAICGLIFSSHPISHDDDVWNGSSQTENLSGDLSSHSSHSLTTVLSICFFGFIFASFLFTISNAVRFCIPYQQLNVILLVLFHCSEFLFVCQCHPSLCSWHAFLLNNSQLYTICILGAKAESLVWPSLINQFKLTDDAFWLLASMALRCCGFALALFGLLLRISACFTARHNFTHMIALIAQPYSHLVTNGVYRYCRHPGYLGWFLWVIGTCSCTNDLTTTYITFRPSLPC